MFKHASPLILRYARGSARQGGSALIVALVFLLVMTVIGVAGMQGTTQQEKMAGNMRNRNLAFQAAEAALRAGERLVDPVKTGTPPACTRPATSDFDGTKGLLQPQPTGGDDGAFWMAVWDWENNSCPNSKTDTPCPNVGTTLAEVAEQPRYVIEDISSLDPLCSAATPPTNDCYRITARGVGGTTESVVILQSTYQCCRNCVP